MQKTARGSEHTRELDEKWDSASQEIVDRLTHGKDLSFITIGDPPHHMQYFFLYL